MSTLSYIISVNTPRNSLKLVDIGQKTITVIAIAFTVVLIMLVDTVPWHLSTSKSRIITTSKWIHPNSDPDTWEPKILPRYLRNRQQSDPELINHIRDYWILRRPERPRMLTNDTIVDYSQYGQSSFYDNYFHEKENGFFVEAGAYDGETYSDSLMLEVRRGWDGLLIEADPRNFRRLSKKNRHAYSLNACLSPTYKPMVLNFTSSGLQSGITGLHELTDKPSRRTQYIQVQCLPLYSILAAIGNRHIDVMFLDLQGAEFDVLQTLPLHDVNIDVFNIEVLMKVNKRLQTQRKADLIQMLLKQHGYKRLDTSFDTDMAMSKLKYHQL